MGAFRNSKNRSLDLWSNGCESVTLVDTAEEDIFQKTLAFQIGKKEEGRSDKARRKRDGIQFLTLSNTALRQGSEFGWVGQHSGWEEWSLFGLCHCFLHWSQLPRRQVQVQVQVQVARRRRQLSRRETGFRSIQWAAVGHHTISGFLTVWKITQSIIACLKKLSIIACTLFNDFVHILIFQLQ